MHVWVEHVFCLPVPEKTQQQHNYILIPRGSCLPTSVKTPVEAADPLLFTVPATAPKTGTVDGANASSVADTYQSLFNWAIGNHLRDAASTTTIVAADPGKFHSMVRQPHRPNEKAVHVKAFRGSKDGYLFFLETGVLWGFKKPVMFIPLARIAAISYTSVLQRTFNMVIEAFVEGGETEEMEFSMLDQEDYGGIDETYVRRKGLQDRSMAEQRRAKMELAENAKKGEGEGVVEGGELEKAGVEAEQQLQDEEDEEEEDYEPGSDADSDGSGTSEESDEDGGGDEEGDEEDDEEDNEGDEEEQDEAPRVQAAKPVAVKAAQPVAVKAAKPVAVKAAKPMAVKAAQPVAVPSAPDVKAEEEDEAMGVVIGADTGVAGSMMDDLDEEFDVVG